MSSLKHFHKVSTSDLVPLSDGPSRVRLGSRRLVGGNLRSNLKESSDHYSRVLCSDGNARLIECRSGLQWIVQARFKTGWRGKVYATSRAGLLRSIVPDDGSSREGWFVTSDKLHDFVRWLPDKFYRRGSSIP